MSTDSVLIVEDTPINMKVVQFVMERAGFEVRTATSAEKALEVLKNFCPRVVLTDIQLPGMNGLELTERLKSNPETRDAIVIALTAFAMKSDEQKAIDAGCDGYVTKPIDTRTFPNLIRQFMASKGVAPCGREPAGELPLPAAEFTLRTLQHTFLTEGIRQSERLMGGLDAGFDTAEARIIAHRWVGAAGQIGYPEISQHARDLEAMLQTNVPESLSSVGEALVRLAQLFSAELAAGGPVCSRSESIT
jgi:two-component system, cell cycle response regulator DivK